MDWRQYIHSDPNIAVGKPVIIGTRIGVEFLLDLYGAGWTEAQILENYPTLTPEALRAVHAYAAEKKNERGDKSPCSFSHISQHNISHDIHA